MKSNKGFTLIELIVVLAVIAILAAILTPVVGRYIDDARRSAAAKDVGNLAAAINMFYKDVGSYPGWRSPIDTTGTDSYDLLISVAGADEPAATDAGWDATLQTAAETDEMEHHLRENAVGGNASATYRTTGRFRWRGPYQQDFKEDSWGNYYAYNSEFIVPTSTKALIVISAGPDENMDTTFSQESKSFTLSNDDIAVQIR